MVHGRGTYLHVKGVEREMRKKAMAPAAVAALLLCFGIAGVVSSASDHRYKPEDPVPLYANKVGPFQNPR